MKKTYEIKPALEYAIEMKWITLNPAISLDGVAQSMQQHIDGQIEAHERNIALVDALRTLDKQLPEVYEAVIKKIKSI